MARRRIREEDLIQFRERADELAQAVGEKYRRMDQEREGAEEKNEPRETGFLLIPDSHSSPAVFRGFAARARSAGFSVHSVDVLGYVSRDSFDRTPVWQRRLEQAQKGLASLSGFARRTVILGCGDGCPLATVLAEQYVTDGLILVGSGPVLRFDARLKDRACARLCGIARNNLFSIVCPVLTLIPADTGCLKKDAAKLYASCSRSDRVEEVNIGASCAEEVWKESGEEAWERMLAFAGSL